MTCRIQPALRGGSRLRTSKELHTFVEPDSSTQRGFGLYSRSLFCHFKRRASLYRVSTYRRFMESTLAHEAGSCSKTTPCTICLQHLGGWFAEGASERAMWWCINYQNGEKDSRWVGTTCRLVFLIKCSKMLSHTQIQSVSQSTMPSILSLTLSPISIDTKAFYELFK